MLQSIFRDKYLGVEFFSKLNHIVIFFNWNSLHGSLNSHCETWSHRKKKYKKIKACRKSFQKEPTDKRYVNSRFKAIQIIGQRKAFYRQKSPESHYVRKEPVDIDILVVSGNGDREITQSIRIMSRHPSIIREWNQLSQFR